MTARQRIIIAQAFGLHRTDLSRYKSEFYQALKTESDPGLLEHLLQTVCWFKEKTPGDLDLLVSILDRFAMPSWKIQLIRSLRRLHGHGFDDRLINTLSRFLGDPDVWVRAEAVEKIGCFKTEPALVEELLVRALNDPSQMVQCKALWNVYYRGPHMYSALLRLAESSCVDRVAAEAIWALAMSPAGKRVLPALSWLADVNRPLTASAKKWSERPDR